MAEDTEHVREFRRITLDFIVAAGQYAGQEFNDPETSRMLRDVAVLTAALLSALQTAQAAIAGRPNAPLPPEGVAASAGKKK